MPRTQKRWLADQPMVDGQMCVFFNTPDVTAGSGAVIDRIAAGNIALSLPTAATAYTLNRDLSFAMFRTGMQDDLQEQFGGAVAGGVGAGAQGLASPPATFTTPAGVSGPPPFTGLSQFTPVTAPRPKGIQINAISCVYEIGSAAATLNTIAIYQNKLVNGVAPAVTTLLAATNLTLTAAATPYVTTVALTSPVMLTAQTAKINLEWHLTTGASTGTALIWGAFLQCSFNYE